MVSAAIAFITIYQQQTDLNVVKAVNKYFFLLKMASCAFLRLGQPFLCQFLANPRN